MKKMENKNNIVHETAKSVAPTTGVPVRVEHEAQQYSEVAEKSEKFWKDRSLSQLSNFKQGITFSSNVNPADSDTVIKNLLYILETGIKNSNNNNELLTKVQITAIFKSLMASVEILKTLNLDVDKNETIAILHGYIIGCISSYEK